MESKKNVTRCQVTKETSEIDGEEELAAPV